MLEATSPGASGEVLTRIVARKIALTCINALGNRIEAELFIRPTDQGKAIFGLLITQGNSAHPGEKDSSEERAIAGRVPPKSLPRERGDVSRSDASSGSSKDSRSLSLPMDAGEWCSSTQRTISAWVDAGTQGFPIVMCTSSFTLGSPVITGAKYLDLLEDSCRPDFTRWLQTRLNELRAMLDLTSEILCIEDVCRLCTIGNNTCDVMLRGFGGGSQPRELRAQCLLDIRATLTGGSGLNAFNEVWPVLLVIHSVTEHSRRLRRRKIGGSKVGNSVAPEITASVGTAVACVPKGRECQRL